MIAEEECKAIAEHKPPPTITMIFDQTDVDRRRYNPPVATEIAAIYVQAEEDEYLERQYVALQYPSSTTVLLNETDPKCNPLCYPLLRPYGDFGWHSNMAKNQFPNELIEYVFGDIRQGNIDELIDRIILSTKSTDSLDINNRILKILPGESKLYFSNDEVVCDESVDKNNFPIEFINTLTPSSYPPHDLTLKKGAIVMFLRNLQINNGLCSGTRLIVQKMGKYSIGFTVATGSRKGAFVILPRITFQPSSYDTSPVKLKRRQFPIRLAFSMTINKSQGQTFTRVGIDLRSPVFAHGQLYVALSRCRRRDCVRILTNSNSDTENIVYKELL